jgi:hypothetical protein
MRLRRSLYAWVNREPERSAERVAGSPMVCNLVVVSVVSVVSVVRVARAAVSPGNRAGRRRDLCACQSVAGRGLSVNHAADVTAA